MAEKRIYTCLITYCTSNPNWALLYTCISIPRAVLLVQCVCCNKCAASVAAQLKFYAFQSEPQDQKSVKILHSVISLSQPPQTSKNKAYIFLNRNNVKVVFSQNILQSV